MIATLGCSGCYYSQLARGQLALLWAREPIEEVLADPTRPPQTRRLLALVESVRDFARELGLRVGDQYTSYVDWPQEDRLITTLVRTREGSLEPVPFWFPVLGRLPYKGYFDRERAARDATRLRARSFDVCESGVAAYSTLGWLDDPVTSPMLRQGPVSLVETILHELVHATAFLPEEAGFNESVAQFIGQEAAVRFFRARARTRTEAGTDGPTAGATPTEGAETESADGSEPWPDPGRIRDLIEDRRAIAGEIVAFRARLLQTQEPGAVDDRLAWRAREEEAARDRLARLPLRVLSAEAVAAAARLSNACLALRGTYVEDLPRHARVLEALGGDLGAMIQRLRRWADEARSVDAFYRIAPAGEHTLTAGTQRRSAADELHDPALHQAPEDR